MNLPTSREVAFVLLGGAVVGVLAIVFGGRLW